jgi:hypothetical protein
LSEKHDETAANLLIDEIEEDLRHERYATLWNRYAVFFATAAVALVLAVVGWQVWHTWEDRQRRESSARYQAALTLAQHGKTADAAKALADLAKTGSPGYRLLARFRQASLAAEDGQAAKASTLYHAIADDSAIDHLYRGMALIKAGYIDLSILPPATVAAEVAPLTGQSNPWRYSAREIKALATLKQGDRKAAIDQFSELAADGGAPRDLRARAADMLAIEKPKSADKPKKSG